MRYKSCMTVRNWMVRVLRKCVRVLIKLTSSVVRVFVYGGQLLVGLLVLCAGFALTTIRLDLLGWWVYWAYVIGALISMQVFIRTTDDSDRIDSGWWLALTLVTIAWDFVLFITLLVALYTKLDSWWVEIKEWCEYGG